MLTTYTFIIYYSNWRHRWCCEGNGLECYKLIPLSPQFLLVSTTAQSLGPLCIFALASVRDVDPFYGCSAAAAMVQQQGRFLWAKAGADHRRGQSGATLLLTTNPAHPTSTATVPVHQRVSLPSFSYIIQYRYKLSIDYVSVQIQTIPFSDVFNCQIRCKDILWETE